MPKIGYKQTEEHIQKISLARKWYKHSEETKKKIGLANSISHKGKKLSEETKKKISESKIGKPRFDLKGKHPIGEFKRGNKPWSYIDGRSKTRGPDRYGDDWDKIRYLVYLRDKFTCQHCGIKKERLDVHHKIPFLISFDNSMINLISLCKPCHRKEEARIMRELKVGEVLWAN